jgi:hypothetical protein
MERPEDNRMAKVRYIFIALILCLCFSALAITPQKSFLLRDWFNITGVELLTANRVLVNNKDVCLEDGTNCLPDAYNAKNVSYYLKTNPQGYYNISTLPINSSYVQVGSANNVKVVYQNITNLPTCLGSDKLKFDGTTLSCSPDIVGGGGAGTSKWVDIGSYITPNVTYAYNIHVPGIVNTTSLNATFVYQNTNIVCDLSNNCAYVTISQGYNYTNFTADLNAATTAWDKDSSNDVVKGSANQTKVYCGNITGSTSNLCTLVDTDTAKNSSYYLRTNPKNYYNSSTLIVPVNSSLLTVDGSGATLKNVNGSFTDLYAAKNTSYYLASNPKGYINVSVGDGAKNESYYLVSNPKGYINASGDSAKNASYVVIDSNNQVKIMYQNITNIPVCSGTNKLTFNGVTLSCSADLQGGEGVYLSKTGDTGIGNYVFNGDLTQGYGFLAAPVGITGTFSYGAAGYLALNTTHSIRVYAYKTISTVRYYSYVGQGLYYTDNNDQVSRYVINWSWQPVIDAEGYKVLKYDNRQGYNYDVAKDLGNVTSFIDGADIALSGVSKIPVAWYHFNSDTKLNDSSTYNNDGIFPGMEEPFVTGKLGQAINFTGTNGAIDIGNDSSLNIRDSISIEAWVNMWQDGDYKGIVVKEYSASYYFGTGTGGEKAISFYYGAMEYKNINVLYFNNTWQHIVMSYNRTNQSATLYVDGVAYPKYIGFNPTVPGLPSNTYVGRQGDGGFQLYGMLDEVVIYNDSLSADEVAFRYNNGTGREEMNSGYTVTYFTDNVTISPTAGTFNIRSKDDLFTSKIDVLAEQDVTVLGSVIVGTAVIEGGQSLVNKYYLASNPKAYINQTTTANFIKTTNITTKQNITGWDAANKSQLALRKGLTGNTTKNFFYKKLNTTLTVQNVTTTACTGTQKSTFNGIKFVCSTDIDTAKNNSYYLKTNPLAFYNTTTLPADPYNAKNTSYYLRTNPKNYYNSSTLIVPVNSSLLTKTGSGASLKAVNYTDLYSAKNVSYYLKTNPLAFYNTSTLPADPYNAKNTSYYLRTNPKSYYNTSTLIVPVNSSLLTKTGSGATLKAVNYTDLYSAKNATYAAKAATGICPYGYAIQNTTSSGIQCVLLDAPNTVYYPSKIATTGGTNTTANRTTMWYDDARSYNITETTGGSPLTVLINYTGVTTFNVWDIKEYYIGSSSHNIQFAIWDYDSSSWEQYWNIVGQNGYNVITLRIADPASHISGGIVQIRLFHVETGISSHRLRIDYSQLLQGNNVGASTSLEGYAKYAFNYNNFYGNGNINTTGFFVGSGAKLKAVNYTDVYNAKNTSYYLASNPKGYINVSVGDGAKNDSYYLRTNPKNYYNSSTLIVPVNSSLLTKTGSGASLKAVNYTETNMKNTSYLTTIDGLSGSQLKAVNYTEVNMKNSSYLTTIDGLSGSQLKAVNYTDAYNAKNTSYYLRTNPKAYYNTSTIPSYLLATGSGATLKAVNYTDLYNAKNISYYLASNPKAYYNTSTIPAYLTATGSGATLKAVNYTDQYNAKNTSYAKLAGDTFTGNVIIQNNLTVERIKLENDAVNNQIYDNASCLILKSGTNQIQLCH